MIASPYILFFLFLLIPMTMLLFYSYRRGLKQLRILVGQWRAESYVSLYVVKWFVSGLSLLLAVLLLLLSAADIRVKGQPQAKTVKGNDIVFLFDVSNSMLAPDTAPTRLKKAVSMAREVLGSIEQSRYGVAAFKGEGSKIIPLTEDLEAIENFMEILSPDVITSPGSNLERGISAALSFFSTSSESQKTVLLFSDGGALKGDILSAAQTAAAAGVKVIAIGLGSLQGAEIPLGDGTFLTDPSGNRVMVRLEPESLQLLAENTGGVYVDAGRRDALEVIREGLWNPQKGSRVIIQTERPLYPQFLIAGFFCLLLYLAVRIIKWRDLF